MGSSAYNQRRQINRVRSRVLGQNDLTESMQNISVMLPVGGVVVDGAVFQPFISKFVYPQSNGDCYCYYAPDLALLNTLELTCDGTFRLASCTGTYKQTYLIRFVFKLMQKADSIILCVSTRNQCS